MPSRYFGEMFSARAISALVATAAREPWAWAASSRASEPARSREASSALARWTRARIPYWVLVGTENTYTPYFLSG